jgi:hypothetical protein
LNAEPGAVLGLAAGGLRLDAAAAKLTPMAVAVVAAVGADPVGSTAWAANPAAYRRDGIDEASQLELDPSMVGLVITKNAAYKARNGSSANSSSSGTQ